MRNTLRSEWTKFYSYHWCIAGIAGAVLIAPVVLLVINAANIQGVSSTPSSGALTQCLRVLFLGQAGVVVAAAGLFGQDYGAGLRIMFLSTPSRMKVMGAKLIVLTIIVISATMLSGILCILVSVIQRNWDWTFQLIMKFMASAALAAVSWVQIACFSAALSVLTKSLIAPIAIIIPLVLGLSQALLSLSPLFKYLPDIAAMNIFLTPNATVFLDIRLGIGVQFAWAALFSVFAVWLTLRSDVR